MLPVYPSICFIISVTLQCDILKLKEYIRKKNVILNKHQARQ